MARASARTTSPWDRSARLRGGRRSCRASSAGRGKQCRPHSTPRDCSSATATHSTGAATSVAPNAAGHRWAGEQQGALARGAAADRLVEHAKAGARASDEVTPPPRPDLIDQFIADLARYLAVHEVAHGRAVADGRHALVSPTTIRHFVQNVTTLYRRRSSARPGKAEGEGGVAG